MHPAPLPPQVPDGPFLFRRARELGVSPERLRRSDLRRITRGVATNGPVPSTLPERARAFALTLPARSAFSHTTSLGLAGYSLPAARGPDDPLHVMYDTDAGRSRRRFIVGHRGLESREAIELNGLQIVDPADSWCDLGELAALHRWTVSDLVVTGGEIVARYARDQLALRRQECRWLPGPERSRREDEIAARAASECRALLRARLDARVRPRGKRLLVAAIPLLRHRSKSPMESRARITFVTEGLPEPELNLVIHAQDGSGFLGECDFVWRSKRVVGEYQGEHHADRRQASHDEAKRSLLETDGWTVIPIWAEDVFHPTRRQALLSRLLHLLN